MTERRKKGGGEKAILKGNKPRLNKVRRPAFTLKTGEGKFFVPHIKTEKGKEEVGWGTRPSIGIPRGAGGSSSEGMQLKTL